MQFTSGEGLEIDEAKKGLKTLQKKGYQIGSFQLHNFLDTSYLTDSCTEDGSTEALLQILYGQYLILGVFGSYMFQT